MKPDLRSFDQQALVVLGMHRSGTSALTGSLNLLGCQAPKNQISGGAQNQKGFFEAVAVARLNDKILAQMNMTWDSWQSRPLDWHKEDQISNLRDDAEAIITQEFGEAPLIALKDPRICRLLPFWIDALESMTICPKFLLIHRHPIEVALSLKTRNGFTKAKSIILWMDHVLDAEIETRGKPRCFLKYQNLMNAPLDELSRVGKQLDLNFPNQTETSATDLNDFLEPALRHFEVENDTLELEGLVAETFSIMESWVKHGENAEDFEVLDQLRARFQTACAPMSSTPSDQADQDAHEQVTFETITQLSGGISEELEDKLQNKSLRKSELADLVDFVSQVNLRLRQQANENSKRAYEKSVQQHTLVQEMGKLANLLTEIEQTSQDNLEREKQKSKIELRAQAAQYKIDNSATETENHELHALVANVENTRRILESENSELHALVARVENARKTLEMENSELHALVAEVEANRHALASSTIWRLSAPLRKAANLFR